MPDYPVNIERKTAFENLWESHDKEWEVVASPLAQISPLSGRELEIAKSVDSRTTHKIRFRWGPTLSDLSTADRLTFRDKVFNFTSILNEGERNEWFECMATTNGTSSTATNGS